jgi:hypothetical protein
MKQANTVNGKLRCTSAQDYEYGSISKVVLQIYKELAGNCQFTVNVTGQL